MKGKVQNVLQAWILSIFLLATACSMGVVDNSSEESLISLEKSSLQSTTNQLPMQQGQSFDEIYAEYLNPTGRMLVVAHRGDWLNHPENSLSGIQGSIDMGVDIVEIDVRKTSDGAFVLMHDSTIQRTTNGSGAVSSMTLAQLKQFYLKEGDGSSGVLTTEKIPTLEEALNAVKGKVMVNLDKAWSYRDDLYNLAVSTGTLKEVIFKSDNSNSIVEPWLDSKESRPNYIALIKDSNISYLDDLLTGAKPDAYELVFNRESSPVASSTTLNKVKGTKRVWVNTLWDSLCAGYTDKVSEKNPDAGWGWVIDKGFNMIQTDKPQQLINYINPPTPTTLSNNWISQDIGSVGINGSAQYQSGTYTLNGSGWDVWGSYDKFHYVYKKISGDTEIIAEVTDISNTNSWAKAGVMIRQSLDPKDRFANVAVTPFNGLVFQRRLTYAQNLSGSSGYSDNVSGSAPHYLRLVKSGDTFSAYHSSGGTAWTQIGTDKTIYISGDFYIGLFITSHAETKLGTANFTNVQLTYGDGQVTLQNGVNGYSGTKDAHIIEYYKYEARNTGGHNLIEAASYSGASNDEKNALIQFDVTSLPDGTTVSEAKMGLYLVSMRNGTATKDLSLHELTGSWVEGTGVGFDGQNVSGVNWLTAPGFDSTLISTTSIGSLPQWYEFDITQQVQEWIDGTKTNYGVVLREETVLSSKGTKNFASSEYATVTLRPKLVITYEIIN